MPEKRRVWALADTHLGAAVGKTMDRFGDYWIGHKEKILQNTRRVVAQEDVLLLPGDLSWAMYRKEAIPDLSFLAALPGIKIAIKGNHDYWWESGRSIDYPGLMSPPQILDDGALGIAGTRGWFTPLAGSESEKADLRVLERERARLQKSLTAIANCETKIVMTHYPPQPFLEDISAAGAVAVVYGHIHLNSHLEDEVLALDGDIVKGVPFYCVACDRIDFTPKRIL
jgi:predicted phosphohydrolase